MSEFESLARTMNALQQEKERQERVELERIKETNRMLKQKTKLEYLRRERRRQQISYHQQQRRRISELEATKILYQDEVQMLLTLVQGAQGIEAEQLRLMAQKRELEIMEIEQELAGVQAQSRSWLRIQIQQLDNRLEMLEEILQAQEQIQLESQLRQMEQEQLRNEAEKLVEAKQELEQKYPPNVVQEILTEMRRLKAIRMAQNANSYP